MKREWILSVASGGVTLILALGLIRWLAPELLGGPTDLTLVQSSVEIPPFYEGVFRVADRECREFQLQDPITRVRSRPLFPNQMLIGPHDVLGFRNRAVPNQADVIVIGDSQTYGNNARVEDNFPSRLEHHLADKAAKVYAMAAGGWGAVQYWDMAHKALALQPQVLVVALYTGNDSLDSFSMAYGAQPWFELRPDLALSASDAPAVRFPPPAEEQWAVDFDDGIAMVFAPEYRLASNQDHPAVAAGYAIMADVAARISKLAADNHVASVFTVIPTAELVYAPKVAAGALKVPAAYAQLVERERVNLEQLAGRIRAVPGARYADVLEPLQKAALAGRKIYPRIANGHPVAAGYDIIARAVQQVVDKSLPPPPKGLAALQVGPGQYQVMVVTKGEMRYFDSLEILQGNGWDVQTARIVRTRQLAQLAWGAPITAIDPGRFGPGGSEWSR